MAYILKEKLADPGNYGRTRTEGQIKYIVIHYTANDGDSAVNNANYFANTVVKSSAHYFVDDKEIYRSVPDLSTAWAVGGSRYDSCDWTGGGSMYGIVANSNSLSIELCDTTRNGTLMASEATLENAAALCRDLMLKYDIPLENVYRHFDVTGKLCPAYMVDADAWAAFKARLKPTLDNMPAAYAKEAVAWAQDNGILSGNANGDLMLNQPLTRQQFAAMLWRYHQKFG